MRKPNRIPGNEDRDPLVRPPSPGEAADSAYARQQSLRERYPGWETIHGKPHDPRFESTLDPNEDPRYDTHLKVASTLPRRPGAALLVWFLFLGNVLMILMGFGMFWHFRQVSPRHPPQPEQTQVQAGSIRNVHAVVADSLRLQRVRHRA